MCNMISIQMLTHFSMEAFHETSNPGSDLHLFVHWNWIHAVWTIHQWLLDLGLPKDVPLPSFYRDLKRILKACFIIQFVFCSIGYHPYFDVPAYYLQWCHGSHAIWFMSVDIIYTILGCGRHFRSYDFQVFGPHFLGHKCKKSHKSE